MIELILLLVIAGVVGFVAYLVMIHLVKQSHGVASGAALIMFLLILLAGWSRAGLPAI